ncbi:hypothetical protein [Actinosynnema sp.]|uniref:hypothetical protein n=1 Tax=Actinosynnema sp. TaxID=1872144 RepID=UPI003F871325
MSRAKGRAEEPDRPSRSTGLRCGGLGGARELVPQAGVAVDDAPVGHRTEITRALTRLVALLTSLDSLVDVAVDTVGRSRADHTNVYADLALDLDLDLGSVVENLSRALPLPLPVPPAPPLGRIGCGLADLLGGSSVRVGLAAIGGAFPGGEVAYRGVVVMWVGPMRLTEDGVDAGAPPILSGLEVVVANRSTVGEQYVDLRPRREDGPVLAVGEAAQVLGRGTAAADGGRAEPRRAGRAGWGRGGAAGAGADGAGGLGAAADRVGPVARAAGLREGTWRERASRACGRRRSTALRRRGAERWPGARRGTRTGQVSRTRRTLLRTGTRPRPQGRRRTPSRTPQAGTHRVATDRAETRPAGPYRSGNRPAVTRRVATDRAATH